MKRIAVLFFFAACLYAPTTTIYSEWGWGYYFWLFGWVGPSQSEGCAAAGFSGSMEYRGYTQFTMTGWPGPGTEITSLVLRLRNNTGGSGLSIDINRVTTETPSGDECGEAPPVYLTSQPVNPVQEEYTYFTLPGAAISDFQSAWQSGASWFGLGYCGTGPMHFFYAFWADNYIDAALLINYTIGVEETGIAGVACGSLQVHPNPFIEKTLIKFQSATNPPSVNVGGGGVADQTSLKIYDVSGRIVKSFSCPSSCALCSMQITWSGTDGSGSQVPPGIYFCELLAGKERLTEKIIKTK